jgi:hypothetical protein
MYPTLLKFADDYSNTPDKKLRRALLGAAFGLFGGTAFTVVAMLADRLFYPQLPMGLDWQVYTVVWSWLGPGLMLVGFVTAWCYELWSGLLSGTLVAAAVLLLSNMPNSETALVSKIIMILILYLPAAVLCLPIVCLLRWLVKRSFLAIEQGQAVGRIALFFLLIILLGSIGGLFMRMPASAAEGIEKMVVALRTEPDPKSNLARIPGLAEHREQPFELYYFKSTRTTQGYDVRAVYDDGYVLLCTIITYPGFPANLSQCEVVTP